MEVPLQDVPRLFFIPFTACSQGRLPPSRHDAPRAVRRPLPPGRRSEFRRGTSVISYADLELDEESQEVRRAGERVALSPTEFDLLHYLLINAERVVSKSQILDRLWDYRSTDGRVVESYISYLRRKIDAAKPPLIHTIRGVAYTVRLPSKT